MAVQPTNQLHNPSPDVILERIDAIIDELQVLRQAVLTLKMESAPNLADALFGALGQGVPEELEANVDVNWKRFRD